MSLTEMMNRLCPVLWERVWIVCLASGDIVPEELT